MSAEEWAYKIICVRQQLDKAEEEVKRLQKEYRELSEYGINEFYEEVKE